VITVPVPSLREKCSTGDRMHNLPTTSASYSHAPAVGPVAYMTVNRSKQHCPTRLTVQHELPAIGKTSWNENVLGPSGVNEYM